MFSLEKRTLKGDLFGSYNSLLRERGGGAGFFFLSEPSLIIFNIYYIIKGLCFMIFSLFSENLLLNEENRIFMEPE